MPDGRFQVELLWKFDKLLVPDSYKLALSRFSNLYDGKMSKDVAYARRYRQNIHDMLRKDYAELCTEVCNVKSVFWYLPHFGVVIPNKPGKLHVVHGAAGILQSSSLNSSLLTGSDLLQPLLGSFCVAILSFEMRSCISNDPEALSLLPKESLLITNTSADVKLDSLATPVRTLAYLEARRQYHWF